MLSSNTAWPQLVSALLAPEAPSPLPVGSGESVLILADAALSLCIYTWPLSLTQWLALVAPLASLQWPLSFPALPPDRLRHSFPEPPPSDTPEGVCIIAVATLACPS